MARSVFLDTNGWLALLNASESRHAEALEIWLDLMKRQCPVVLTDWIIAETGNGLARSRTKNQFVDVVTQMLEAPSVEAVFIDDSLLRRSLAIYGAHADKAWGLVDCTSFTVMRERGVTEAFTSDHDFEQASFRCLINV
jgi:predicted nucleic acid-binding protein